MSWISIASTGVETRVTNVIVQDKVPHQRYLRARLSAKACFIAQTLVSTNEMRKSPEPGVRKEVNRDTKQTMPTYMEPALLLLPELVR